MNTIWIIVGVIVLVLIVIAFIYNSFITMRVRVKEGWADIDTQLKRRYDLIPNLIETVKGYAVHEREVFEKVTLARTQALGAQTVEDHANAENMLSGTLKSLFAVSENYPDLKANTNFLELQRELSDTENKIQAARRFYNTTVRDFNTAIQSFPGNIIASVFGFKVADFFELSEEVQREPVKVSFQ